MAYRLPIILLLGTNRFTLILLPHLPPGFILYSGKGYYLYQLTPMSNACLTIWNSTLSVSSLALPSHRVRNTYQLVPKTEIPTSKNLKNRSLSPFHS